MPAFKAIVYFVFLMIQFILFIGCKIKNKSVKPETTSLHYVRERFIHVRQSRKNPVLLGKSLFPAIKSLSLG